ncbi:hypothetical protein, partial [Nonomuraea sp. NPDC049784]|uniref:hypothetical protein n=1 Tax=Nonomuraea sp. NPDC049784 TaxID=3154361 RepID=UPI0033D069A4
MVVAPVLTLILAALGGLDLAGPMTGLAAAFLLRGQPVKGAVATLYGSVAALPAGSLLPFAIQDDGTDFGDLMAGGPGWAAGAVLAYLIAARKVPRAEPRPKPRAGSMAVAASVAAVLACAQILAAKALEVTLWVDYHEFDGPGWYRDLTHAAWYPAASVVIASLIAVPAGAVEFVVINPQRDLECLGRQDLRAG